jgi:SAM-dependent methyltransferase
MNAFEGPEAHKKLGNWAEYWDQDDFWTDSEIWKINAALFFKRAFSILQPKPWDKVLNIGCGPGYLEMMLSPHVQSICAVDTSRRYVDLCREKCSPFRNVQAEQLKRKYTDVAMFGSHSLYLCVSVVQYYRNKNEIEDLIRSVQRSALPGARMLIADLPLQRNGLGKMLDFLCSFFLSIREGYVFDCFFTLLRLNLKSSKYRTFGKRVKTLSFSHNELRDLIKRLNLKAEIIQKSLSIYANRPSLWIEF